VRLLTIGYEFKDNEDLDRVAALNADLAKINDTFKMYHCKISKLVGYTESKLLSALKDEEDQLREILQVESGKKSPIRHKMKIYFFDWFFVSGENIDLLFVFVSSHGWNDGFVLTDTTSESGFVKIKLRQIWEALNSVGFLKQAVKIYLIQACFDIAFFTLQ
jgi:hypothetical protein